MFWEKHEITQWHRRISFQITKIKLYAWKSTFDTVLRCIIFQWQQDFNTVIATCMKNDWLTMKKYFFHPFFPTMAFVFCLSSSPSTWGGALFCVCVCVCVCGKGVACEVLGEVWLRVHVWGCDCERVWMYAVRCEGAWRGCEWILCTAKLCLWACWGCFWSKGGGSWAQRSVRGRVHVSVCWTC